MRIAITGASGMIGTALTAALEERGDEAVPVVRRDPRPGEAAIRWDPEHGEIDVAGLEGLDAVVHLAGTGIAERRWSEEQKRSILESRTRGTTLLAEALAGLEQRPRVLVSSSAIGFYGDRGDEVLTEASEAGEGFLAEVCVKWEACSRLASAAGVRTVNIRTGIVLDAKGGALAKQLPAFKLGAGGRIGSGRQWQSWISLHDVVGAIVHLIESDVEGPVNLTAPEPVTNAELARSLGRVLRRPAILPIPTFAPAMLYGRELVEALLLASQRVQPRTLMASGYDFAHPEIEAALRAVLDRPADDQP